MLENIPSVEVDFQNRSINLRGNRNVNVLIDGKPSNLSSVQVLRQIPASSVKSVEIITNPSAKYNPEGMSGIINIILKKNTTIGFNGIFTLGVEHSINSRPSGSLNFNYRAGKLNFYGNYGLDLGKFETFSFLNRLDKDLSQDINFMDNSTSHYGKAGLDFYINDKNIISFFTTRSIAYTDFYVNTRIISDYNLLFDSQNLSLFDTKETGYNLDYKLDFNNKGEYLELEVNYSKSRNPQDDTITENINLADKTTNYKNSILSNNSFFLVNLDYAKPLKNGMLEIGLESKIQDVFHKINTDQLIETSRNLLIEPKGNSELTYNREIYSAHINLTKDFKKLTFQAGLRFEQFDLDGVFYNTEQPGLEPIDDKIFSIYPSAYITYSPSKKKQFQLGYSRRVDRPSIGQVTPIQEWTSPLSISIGNRDLVPQFTNSLEFNYTKTINKGSISFGSFYRKTQDVIGRVFSVDISNPDRQIISYANYNSSKSYGFEFSSQLKLYKWWVIRPSANLYIQNNQGFINNNLEVAKNSYFTARISNSFKANKKLRFSLSTSYKGNNENVLTKLDDFFLVNLAARYEVIKGNGTITLRGTDIFDGYKLNFSSTSPFPQVGQFSLEYSSVYLGFTYNFGKGKNRERDRKYRKENEVQESGSIL